MKHVWVVALMIGSSSFAPMPAQAGPFGEALGGAVGGSLVGGLIGGKRGARVGAAIGGVNGLSRGVQRERNARDRAQRDAAYYRHQAEMERYRNNNRDRYSAPQSTASTTVTEIQKSLIRLGYEPGEVGRFVPATREAIMAYQADHGLLTTGEASQELLRHMLQNGG